jgi:hypothetical protein
MGIKSAVATDKARLVAYCEPVIKEKLERLAALRIRSLSNLIEAIVTDAITAAEESGELKESDVQS